MKEDVLLSWEEYRNRPLEEFHYKSLSPVINYNDTRTHLPHRYTPAPSITYRIQDLLTRKGKPTQGLLEIKDEGGIENMLNIKFRNIILSQLAPDPLLKSMLNNKDNSSITGEILDNLGARYIAIGDAPIYGNTPKIEEEEWLEKANSQTEAIVNDNPHVTPIGIVSGATIARSMLNIDELKERGVDKLFACHVGHILYHGNTCDKARAYMFSKEIYKKTNWLMLIGGGSYSFFQKYFFANIFVSDAHWIAAYNGFEMLKGRWHRMEPYTDPTELGIMRNLNEEHNILAMLEGQSKISEFIKEPVIAKY